MGELELTGTHKSMTVKEYEFTVQLKFTGEGKDRDECFENGVDQLDMYSVDHLFSKNDIKIVNTKRVDNG